jgi:lysophospholipase L1-like esterase
LIIFISGCVPSKNLAQHKLEQLYPPDNTLISYHTDWTKTNYKVRIQQFKKEPLNFGDIAFIGNSITEQGGDWNTKFVVSNIRNRGISGDVTDGVLVRLKEITYFKPKAVFLLIGINDLYNLNDRKEIPSAEYVANNILKIAETIHKGSRKTKIYIQTILPTSKEYLKKSIEIVNGIIKQNAQEGLYKVIDLHSKFTNEKGLIREDLTTDGTHLNNRGYDVWVKFIKPLVVNQINNIQFVYPNGTVKSLIMSYDDGLVDDLKLTGLFNENHIVGTFCLNSGYLSTVRPWEQSNGSTIYQRYVSKDSLDLIYKNHEIAAHGKFHKNFSQISDDKILEDVNSDILSLQTLTKREIKSFAYPFGSTSEHIASVMAKTGITNARTVKETNTFGLPGNYLLWDPTCHDSKALPILNNYLSLDTDTLTLFYVWGHSWELRDQTRWNNMVDFCQKAGNRKDIWYVGCGEFVDYHKSLKAIRIAPDFIENPKGNNRVWYKENGILKVLNAGERIHLRIKQ